MGSVTVGEEVCPWGSILMFQKTCPRPSHKLTHAVHMYTHTEKLSGWMDGNNTFKEFSSLVDTSKKGTHQSISKSSVCMELKERIS